MENKSLWNRDFFTICFSSFFIFITFYILAVTLPSFVLDHLHGSNQDIGLVTTVFVIAAVIFRPLTGKWLDEVDRKKLVIVSLISLTICSVLYLFISDYYLLLILRFIHGIAFGISATATSTLVLDTIPENRKGEGIGYFSLFMSLAMVFGPFIGLTLTTHTSFNALFIIVALLSFLSLVCVILTNVPVHTPIKSTLSTWNIKRYIEPKAIPISLVGFVIAFSYGALSTFVSVYAQSIGLEHMASYFFIVFASVILLSRPFTGKIFDRFGEHVLVYPGIILFIIGMIWLSQAYSAPVFLITGGIIGLGFGAILPSFQTIAIQASLKNRRGLATSTYFVFFDSGYGFGSYILGIIATKTSYHMMYFVGGIVVLLALVIYYIFHHRKQKINNLLRQLLLEKG